MSLRQSIWYTDRREAKRERKQLLAFRVTHTDIQLPSYCSCANNCTGLLVPPFRPSFTALPFTGEGAPLHLEMLAEEDDELLALVSILHVLVSVFIVLSLLQQQEFDWLLNEEVNDILSQLHDIVLVSQICDTCLILVIRT